MKARLFTETILRELRDPEFAAAYLKDSADELETAKRLIRQTKSVAVFEVAKSMSHARFSQAYIYLAGNNPEGIDNSRVA